MKNIFVIVLFYVILSLTCNNASNVNDFCIADLQGPDSPSGYHCRPPNTVTSNDFKYSFSSANISFPDFKVVINPAFVTEFPALNGLGISAVRGELDRGGFFPMHSHPGGNEILIILKGEVIAGILTPTKAYVNTLKEGDLIVFPQGQLHFFVNSGKEKVIAIATYSSPNPRFNLLFQELFANNASSEYIALTTFLDLSQVKKNKARFGGSG